MSILGNTSLDVNKILPMKRPWAWEMYKKGRANNWMPEEIPSQDDVEQWKSKTALTEEERNLILMNLGFFSTAESLTGSNLIMCVYKYIKDPACRQYLIQQISEEGVHVHMFIYICDSLGLDPDQIYNMYKTQFETKEKDDFVVELTSALAEENLDMSKDEDKKKLLFNLLGYYIIFEGIMFYAGFAMMLALKNKNKMSGIGQQFEYTLRDECLAQDTELLTPFGWKKVQDITYEDNILQWHTDGTTSFTKPKKLSKSYVNKVYHFKNQGGQVSQKVSENHRMVYLNRNNKLTVEPAKNVTSPRGYYINAGAITGGTRLKLTPRERFLIALQADGTIPNPTLRNGKKAGYRNYKFSFSKQRKIDRLTNILSELEWEYSISYPKNSRGPNVKPLTTFHVKVPLDTPIDKNFSSWVNFEGVTANWCREFIDEMAEWDGHRNKKALHSIKYASVIKSNCDIIQAVACLANCRTCYNKHEDHRKDTFSDLHNMTILTNDNTICSSIVERTELEYNDYVYGVEVDSSFLIIRHDNAVSVTGNSLHVEFGTRVIKDVLDENPQLWTQEFKDSLIAKVKQAVKLEFNYIEKACPTAVVGIPQKLFKQYIEYIADRRLESIGLPAQYKTENPFPWLSKVMDLSKETNFFEKRVTEYAMGTLEDWD